MSNRTPGAYDKIRWVSMPPPAGTTGGGLHGLAALNAPAAGVAALSTAAAAATAEHPLIAFLRTTGLPLPEAAAAAPPLTAKAWAIFLLHAAAEVEHQFVVQYLYAFFCGNANYPLFNTNRFKLFTIAVEEMGHLLTVQNLLLLLDSPFYLTRLTPANAGVEPFPLSLKPFSLPFLARFVAAESPANPNPPLPGTLEGDLGDNLTLLSIHRVGAVYAMLAWLLKNDAERQAGGTSPIGDPHLDLQLQTGDFADPARVRAFLNIGENWGAVGNVLVLPLSSEPLDSREDLRHAAQNAITAVSAQGEGPAAMAGGANAPSHYASLLKIYTAVKADASGVSSQGDFVSDPLTTGNASDAHVITDPATLKLALASDAHYQIMLTLIALSVVTSDAAFRTASAEAAHDQMRTFNGFGNQFKSGKPLKSPPGIVPQSAGPPFTLPSTPFPAGEKELCQRLLTEAQALTTNFGDTTTELQATVNARLAVL